MAHWFTNHTSRAQAAPAPVAAAGIAGVDHKQLLRLMASVKGAFYLPGDAGYPTAARQANPMFVRTPIAVVRCMSVADVQACIRWCNELGVSATFRSSGHSTAGYSVLDQTLTVDLSGLNEIVIDPAGLTASVQSGVNFDQFNAALDKHKLHVPGGGCGSVCVAGYMQGGGYGFTSRCFGMNCDSVSEIEFLTRDGDVQTADVAQNTDLFWAFRGGTGGNFGVITKITYALYPLGKIWGFGLTWDLDKAPDALRVMQAGFMRGGPDSIGYMTFIMARQDRKTGAFKVALFMRGVCIEGQEAGRKLLATLVKAGGVYDLDREGTYAFLNGFLLADLEPKDLGAIYELKVSNYIAKPLAVTDWQEVVKIFSKSPGFKAGHANTLVLEPYGGKIAEKSPRTDNAFIHRDVDMNFVIDSFYGPPDEKPAAEVWLKLFADFLRGPNGRSNRQVYQNYPEADLVDWREAYFAGAFARLLQIKGDVDPGTAIYPNGFFSYPQSIKPQSDAN